MTDAALVDSGSGGPTTHSLQQILEAPNSLAAATGGAQTSPVAADVRAQQSLTAVAEVAQISLIAAGGGAAAGDRAD